MNRITKNLLRVGGALMMVAIIVPTCLAVGYNLLKDCGFIHALPDSKQQAMRDISWFTDLIRFGSGFASLGFVFCFSEEYCLRFPSNEENQIRALRLRLGVPHGKSDDGNIA
jgi:hypothetical protein